MSKMIPLASAGGSFLGLRGISGALSGSRPLIGFPVLSIDLRARTAVSIED